MSATIINGKEIAFQIREKLKNEIQTRAITPKLAVILAGHDPASEIYVKNKQKAAAEVGIETVLYRFEDDVNPKELEDLIDALNKDFSVNGILLQLPLPEGIDSSKILNRISPQKDVDGFHPFNMGLLMAGMNGGTVAATPKGILRLLKHAGIELAGKNALVIGRSNIVGKPMAMLLLNEDCTVSVAHSKTKDLKSLCQNADIIVSATGCLKLVQKDFIKDGAVLIDVGICRDENGKLCGDIDFEACLDKASFMTPVPGGVGPMTIAMLLENVLEAYLKQNA